MQLEYTHNGVAMRSLHLLYIISQHPLNLIAHGFSASITEMNADNIGYLANFLHQC